MPRYQPGSPGPGSGRAGCDPPRDQVLTLLRTVETQVIPRLMLLHEQEHLQALADGLAGPAAQRLDEPCIEAFTDLLQEPRASAAAFVDGLRLQGVPLPAIYLGLFAPAARRLGVLWCEDRCDFTTVTLGLGRLQHLLRDLASESPGPRLENQPSKRVLLLPAPGEQHTFGLSMVMEFFRLAGWLVWHEPPANAERLQMVVAEHWFDAIGFSIGGERHLDLLRNLVADVRRSARNRAALLMVGGPLAGVRPDLAAEVGADVQVTDASQAMLLAERHVVSR